MIALPGSRRDLAGVPGASRAAHAPAALTALFVFSFGACVHAPVTDKLNVGGHRLQYRCSGRGTPVVVLDSGLGDTMDAWGEITPEVERFTRVCVYDRAGLGRSDPGPMPRTSQRIVDDLTTLLERAEVRAPYVLVGHSLGGLNARLYASEHPDRVVGLILVDATHEAYPARERELRPPAEQKRMETYFGLARPAARSEYESLDESVREVRTAPPLPDIPLTVITAGRHSESGPMKELWMELQADLLRLSPRSHQVFARESGHYVQFDQPGVIVTAIREMVGEIRGAPIDPPPPRKFKRP